MSKTRQLLLAFLAALVAAACFSGCSAPPKDSSIPWSRPAEWEGRIPGMGAP